MSFKVKKLTNQKRNRQRDIQNVDSFSVGQNKLDCFP